MAGVTFNRSFILSLILGQALSLFLTLGNTASTALAMNYHSSVPTAQSLLNYVFLAAIYTPYNIYKNGFRSYLQMQGKRWYLYVLLALIDVEGNYFYVKAFNLTSLLSAMLLDAWTIPVVVVLSITLLKQRYHLLQYVGVVMGVAGIAVLLLTDSSLRTDSSDPIRGDILCIIAATLFGVSNIFEEFLVLKYSIPEVVGQLGLYGSIISGIQLLILERAELQTITWSPASVGLFLAYNAACVGFYTMTPILFRMRGATFFNLSLLTSDIYGLAVGVFVFQSKMGFMYPVAYVVIIASIIVYNLKQPVQHESTSEEIYAVQDGDDDSVKKTTSEEV